MIDIITQITEVATTTAASFDLKKILSSNAIAQGGLVLGAMGILAAYARSLPALLYGFLRGVFVLTVEIESQGSSFYKNRVLRNVSKYRRDTIKQSVETDFQYQETTDSYKTAFRVGIGHFYAKEKFWMKITRTRNTNNVQLTEFLYIETFIWNKKRLNVFIDSAMNTSEKTTNIFINDGGEWEQKCVFRGRSFDDIILQPGVKETIVADITAFQQDRDWYISKGAPHQRGYALTGKPGTGKTSISAAIATALGKNLYTLHLTKLLTDQNLTNLFNTVDGVILIEDIDGILNGRTILLEGASWTFSGLLNAINGANPDTRSRVIVMTTNHPETLDPALIRPGRIDQIWDIGCIGAEQAVMLFRVFHEENSAVEDGIRKEIGDAKVQPVILREIYINQKRDIANIPESIRQVIGAPFGDLPQKKLEPVDALQWNIWEEVDLPPNDKEREQVRAQKGYKDSVRKEIRPSRPKTERAPVHDEEESKDDAIFLKG